MAGPIGVTGTSDVQLQAMVNATQDSVSKQDFMKLLLAQMRNQNPLEPMEDKEFMAQMAQFSTLEQVTKVAENMELMSHSDQVGQGVSLIGKTVSYTLADETTGEGTVGSLTIEDGVIRLDIEGVSVKPSEITKVLA